jgi:hypothetical protein
MNLEPLLEGGGDLALWQNALEKIETGAMPPKKKPRPAAEEKRAAADWLTGLVLAGKAAVREKEGRVVLRRLNRVEYENTVSDLLGVPVRVREMLPPDAVAGGFDNVGEALHSSSFLLARYLEAAEDALDQAIASGPQPRVKKEHLTINDAYQMKQDKEYAFRKGEGGRVVPKDGYGDEPVCLCCLKRGSVEFRVRGEDI